MKWRDWRLAFYLAAAGLVWCIAVGFLLYVLPLGSSVSTSSTGAQVESRERIFTLSLSSLWPLILPVLLCALATWAAARHHRWPLIVAMVLLVVFARSRRAFDRPCLRTRRPAAHRQRPRLVTGSPGAGWMAMPLPGGDDVAVLLTSASSRTPEGLP